MIEPEHYELIDFGDGRKLERFAKHILDRPCPAADGLRIGAPSSWSSAAGRFLREEGIRGKPAVTGWQWGGATLEGGTEPEPWRLPCGAFTLELRATPFGHVGVFPEQVANWGWIAGQVRRCRRAPRVLNLFAYTGASTLAAAAAGAEVTHIDGARNVVAWARHNAQLSGLDAAPIRWIAEDASRFVDRELRRGNRYQGIILDPPSYGHGPKGQVWKVERDLLPLLRQCATLLEGQPRFILLTCHSPGFGPAELEASLADAIAGSCAAGAIARPLYLVATDGRKLPAGATARWCH